VLIRPRREQASASEEAMDSEMWSGMVGVSG
jgi:hypothetical protein